MAAIRSEAGGGRPAATEVFVVVFGVGACFSFLFFPVGFCGWVVFFRVGFLKGSQRENFKKSMLVAGTLEKDPHELV